LEFLRVVEIAIHRIGKLAVLAQAFQAQLVRPPMLTGPRIVLHLEI
jgi:hypothetical protein